MTFFNPIAFLSSLTIRQSWRAGRRRRKRRRGEDTEDELFTFYFAPTIHLEHARIMVPVEVSTKNVDDYDKFRRNITRALKKAVTKIRRRYLKRLKKSSPYRTGWLREHIRVDKKGVTDHEIKLFFGIADRSAFYAFILNAGYPRGRYKGWIQFQAEVIARFKAGAILKQELEKAGLET